MAWHVILCSIAYIDAPNKGIEQACSWASCDIHISPFSINLYFNLSNVLLVLALNLIEHKSSYCKCSLAWCQARTFLLFIISTHPLKWENTRSNMQVLTKIKIPTISILLGIFLLLEIHLPPKKAGNIINFIYSMTFRKIKYHNKTIKYIY